MATLSLALNKQLASPRTIWLILAFGVILRLFAVVILSDYPLLSDAESYNEVALQIYNGEPRNLLWPPGLPYYLSSLYSIFGVSDFIARASMIVFYGIMTLALYLLGKEFLSLKATNLLVLVFTLYPNYLYHSVSPLTHLPVAAYMVVALYLTYKITHTEKINWSWVGLLGITLGAMALTRPSSLSLLAFILPYLIYKTRKWIPSITPLIITLLMVAAYILYLHSTEDQVIFINYGNSYNLFIGNNPDTPFYKTWLLGSDVNARPERFNLANYYIIIEPIEKQDHLYRQAAIDHILDRPDLFLIRTFSRIRSYFGFDTFTGARLIEENIGGTWLGGIVILVDTIFYLAVMIPAIMFFYASMKKVVDKASLVPRQDNSHISRKIPFVLLMGFALFYSLPYFVVFSHATYHFQVVPLFAVLAVALIDQFDWEQIRTLLKNRWLLFTLGIFLLIQIEWGLVMLSEFVTP